MKVAQGMSARVLPIAARDVVTRTWCMSALVPVLTQERREVGSHVPERDVRQRGDAVEPHRADELVLDAGQVGHVGAPTPAHVDSTRASTARRRVVYRTAASLPLRSPREAFATLAELDRTADANG